MSVQTSRAKLLQEGARKQKRKGCVYIRVGGLPFYGKENDNMNPSAITLGAHLLIQQHTRTTLYKTSDRHNKQSQ